MKEPRVFIESEIEDQEKTGQGLSVIQRQKEAILGVRQRLGPNRISKDDK